MIIPNLRSFELSSMNFDFQNLPSPAGTYMSGSIRWKKVDALKVRFDIVTYWTRSFSVYNNPVPGQDALVALTAQNTVQFDPGDGSTPRFLKANVTDYSLEEDWFSAVSVFYYTYPRVMSISLSHPYETNFVSFLFSYPPANHSSMTISCRAQPWQSSVQVPDYSNASDGKQASSHEWYCESCTIFCVAIAGLARHAFA